MNEAWEIAKKCFAEYKTHELDGIFGENWNFSKIMKYTPQEAKEKIEAWEKVKINVGDVVTDGHVTMLVTGIGGESGLLFLLGKDGEIKTRQKPELFTKTGRTLDIQTILSKIECDEDLPFDL